MLKRGIDGAADLVFRPAAFGRLCVETFEALPCGFGYRCQPPSGGCVLKQLGMTSEEIVERPAAFGRLCVETCSSAFGR